VGEPWFSPAGYPNEMTGEENGMLLNTAESVLLVIDVQAKLLPGVQRSEELVDNCRWLVRLAQLMEVPIVASEQYPQGLGPTEDGLRELIGAERFHGKTCFSSVDTPSFAEELKATGRRQAVLCGMESQACVIQTALRLLDQGTQVYVVADAISARKEFDTEVALRRMEQAGAVPVTCEMVGFEWLRRADAPAFKTFSKEFLR
jgi:nicotinamidase-related amidase